MRDVVNQDASTRAFLDRVLLAVDTYNAKYSKGVSVGEISGFLRINKGAAEYYLDTLCSQGELRTSTEDGRTLYHQTDEMYGY